MDNDQRVREALTAMLLAEGCEVQAVADRDQLRSALATFSADVILADYHLDAGDNGIAALQWALGDEHNPPPCVIVSADDGQSVRDLARGAGYRSLPKPVNPARLTALIAALAS
jgi:DNA-binding response OmpR family regulator